MKHMYAYAAALISVVAVESSAFGQSDFQRTIDFAQDLFSPDAAHWAESTSDAGAIVLGAPSDTDLYARILKLDAAGAVQWARDCAPTGVVSAEIAGCMIIPSTMGGYAFTGYFGVTSGTDGATIVRLDANGNAVWSRQFQTAMPVQGTSFTLGPSVDEVPESNGGYVVTSQEFGHPALHRVSEAGGTLFTKRYVNQSVPPADARGAFNDVHALSDGFIAVGWLGVPPTQGAAPEAQTLVVRTDMNGEVLWAKTYRQNLYNTAWGVDLASNGDFLISGYSKDAAEGAGLFLLRIDSIGTVIHHEWFVGVHANRSIEELADGNILLGATVIHSFMDTQTGALLTDGSCSYLACWAFGSTTGLVDVGRCAMPTADGGFMVLGQTDSFDALTGRDMYYIKLDAATAAGTSGCYETSVLPSQTTGLCRPYDEFFVIESGAVTPLAMMSNPPVVVTRSLCCPEDIDGNLTVDVQDLLALLATWGQSGGPTDVNGDGVVDVGDLLALLAAWGRCS